VEKKVYFGVGEFMKRIKIHKQDTHYTTGRRTRPHPLEHLEGV